MKKNVGTVDRVIRVIVGFCFVGGSIWYFGFQSVLGIILVVLGAVMVVTALIGYCPPYALLGISTCKKK